MDDQKKTPARAETNSGRRPRTSDLTVMVFGKVGKSRTFRISSRLLRWAAGFFVLFILASILVFNQYFTALRENRSNLEALARLKAEMAGTRRDLDLTQNRLALLEDALRDRAAGPGEERVADPADTAADPEPRPAVETPPEASREMSAPAPVEVRDLNIHREGDTLVVDFKLANIRGEAHPVNGYLHIIAMNEAADPPQWRPYPKVALRNGVPVNYRRGMAFSIRRFKNVRGKYSMNSGDEMPSAVNLLVYDPAGLLILEKRFRVANVP